MVDVDGMVGWLVQLMEDAHIATCLGCCCEDRRTELVFVHCLRTTESEQNAAWLYFLKGFSIQSCITLQCIAQGILVLGKGWRVENDEVVRCLHLLHELEGIFCVCLMTLVVREV